MRLKARLISIVLAALFTLQCGAARHVVVQVDASFATAVFAASDAAMDACKSGIFTPAQCAPGGDVNRNAQQALIDVKAVTAAIQAVPDGTTVPTNLPTLLTSLTQLQSVIGALAPAVPAKADLASKISAALAQAIKVVAAFTGGSPR